MTDVCVTKDYHITLNTHTHTYTICGSSLSQPTQTQSRQLVSQQAWTSSCGTMSTVAAIIDQVKSSQL